MCMACIFRAGGSGSESDSRGEYHFAGSSSSMPQKDSYSSERKSADEYASVSKDYN